METTDHDQLFKQLLSTFFLDFLELFFPEVLTYLEPDSLNLRLNEQEESQFREQIGRIRQVEQQGQVMQIVTSWLTQGIEQGLTQGIEQGMV